MDGLKVVWEVWDSEQVEYVEAVLRLNKYSCGHNSCRIQIQSIIRLAMPIVIDGIAFLSLKLSMSSSGADDVKSLVRDQWKSRHFRFHFFPVFPSDEQLAVEIITLGH